MQEEFYKNSKLRLFILLTAIIFISRKASIWKE